MFNWEYPEVTNTEERSPCWAYQSVRAEPDVWGRESRGKYKSSPVETPVWGPIWCSVHYLPCLKPCVGKVMIWDARRSWAESRGRSPSPGSLSSSQDRSSELTSARLGVRLESSESEDASFALTSLLWWGSRDAPKSKVQVWLRCSAVPWKLEEGKFCLDTGPRSLAEHLTSSFNSETMALLKQMSHIRKRAGSSQTHTRTHTHNLIWRTSSFVCEYCETVFTSSVLWVLHLSVSSSNVWKNKNWSGPTHTSLNKTFKHLQTATIGAKSLLFLLCSELTLFTCGKAGEPWSCLQIVSGSPSAGEMCPPRVFLLWGNEEAGNENKTMLVWLWQARFNAWWSLSCDCRSLSRVFKLSTSLCRLSTSSRQSLEPKLSNKKQIRWHHCPYIKVTLKKVLVRSSGYPIRQSGSPVDRYISTSPQGCLAIRPWRCVPSDCWAHVQLLSSTAPSVCPLLDFVSFLPSLSACKLPLGKQTTTNIQVNYL